jgi:Matrixin
MRSRMLLVLPVLVAGWLFAVAAPAAAFEVYGPVWRDDDITYYNAYEPYDTFVERGVRAWNASGMNARYRRVTSASKADVRIGLFGKPAVPRLPSGVVGYTRLAVLDGRVFVGAKVSLTRLTPDGVRKDGSTLQLVVNHELGHALGLDHEQDTCAVLNAQVKPAGPEKCGTPPPGKRYCRMLELDDERGAVKLYGGRAAPIARPRYC